MNDRKDETPDEQLTKLVDWFETSEDASQEARKASERDRDYYDNIQLTAEELAELKRRGQPAIIINRIQRKIDFLLGVEQNQRTDPKAFPRTPEHDQDAEAVTDALRFVTEDCGLDSIRSEVWKNLLIEGAGGAEVAVEPKRQTRQALMGSTSMAGPQYDVKIRQVAWDRMFWDPHSCEPDFSDARYMGVVVWMDYDEACERWPEGKDALEHTMSSTSIGETYDDKPRWQQWADQKRKRVRIVQMAYREAEGWHLCTFTKGGKLESGPSPYLDEDGEPENPFIFQSAYVDRENRRYGVVRSMVGPQDEVNKRRSKALHLITQRQTFGRKGAVEDVNLAKQELAKPDGHLEVNGGEFGKDFGVLPTSDMAAAQFQLLQEAKNEIDLMGPNASMQGKGPEGQSGRAIIAQQQGGYIELGPMTDRLRHWNVRVYRAIWNRIRQFWTEERWIRVTDDERNVRFVGLNRTITAGEAYQRELEAMRLPPEQIQADMQMIAGDPRAQTPVGVENNLAEMMVDIIVDDAPDTITIQHEQFQELVKLAPVLKEEGLPVGQLLIKASQLRDKESLLELIQKTQETMGQTQQEAAQLERDQKEADVGKTVAEMQKIVAETQAAGMPQGEAPPDPLEQAKTAADIGLTRAQTVKTGADAVKTLVDAATPPPPPQPQMPAPNMRR